MSCQVPAMLRSTWVVIGLVGLTACGSGGEAVSQSRNTDAQPATDGPDASTSGADATESAAAPSSDEPGSTPAADSSAASDRSTASVISAPTTLPGTDFEGTSSAPVPTSESVETAPGNTSGEGAGTGESDPGGGYATSETDDSSGAVGGDQHIEIPPPGSDVQVPNGCDEVTYFAPPNPGDFCSYFTACGDALTIGATIDPAGVEWHHCSRFGEYYDFRLTGISGMDACSVGANLCMVFSGDVTSPEQCKVERPVDTEAHCATELRCTHPVDLGSGIVAHVDAGASKISCEDQGQGRFGCGCQDRDGATRSLLVDAPSSDVACAGLESACLDGETLTFSEQRECTEELPLDSWDFGCSAALACTRAAAPSANGAVIRMSEENTASCNDVNGAWDCYCTAGEHVAYHYRPVIKSEPEVACLDAVDVCRTGLEPSGGVTCSSEETSLTEDGCARSINCAQPAQSGALQISRITSGAVECTQANGGWDCPCYDGGDEVTFHYRDPQQSAAGACIMAAEECADRGNLGL